jgi:hypothetical protein
MPIRWSYPVPERRLYLKVVSDDLVGEVKPRGPSRVVRSLTVMQWPVVPETR